jgi:FHS family L-fucose permease-like MFS transporter
MEQKKNYTLPIIMMIALFAMISFVTGLSNPFGVIVKNQFQASNFASQLGTFANFLAYLFMGIPSGMLLQKYGYKVTALIAVAVGFLGVGVMFLSGVAESFAVYLTGAFVAGFSMCMLNAVVNPMLNTLAGGGKKGNQLIQIGGSFNSLSATIVPVFVGYLIGDITKATIANANPALFIAMGIFALVFIVIAFVNIPEPHMSKDKTQTIKHERSPWAFRHFVLGAVAIFVYVGVEVGIPNIMNLFMTDAGALAIDAAAAGSVVGTYWFLMFIGRMLGGVLGAKFSSKSMLTFVASLGMLLVLVAIFCPAAVSVTMPVFQSDISFGMAQVPLSIMLLVLCGLCTSVMWGGIFNLAVEGLGKYTPAASGIFMMMVCGGGVLPLLQGKVADMAGYMPSYWIIVAGMAYMLYYALAGCKNVNKDITVE